MSGKNSEVARVRAAKGGEGADCKAGSEDLCSCSQLMKRGAIDSFDDCTQEAAIDYCEKNGPCESVATY